MAGGSLDLARLRVVGFPRFRPTWRGAAVLRRAPMCWRPKKIHGRSGRWRRSGRQETRAEKMISTLRCDRQSLAQRQAWLPRRTEITMPQDISGAQVL